MNMSAPTRDEVRAVEATVREMLEREYASNNLDSSEEAAFQQGLRDGFSLAFQGFASQAFPTPNN